MARFISFSTVSGNMRELIDELVTSLEEILPEVPKERLDILIKPSNKPEYGDFALPCFSFAKTYKKDPKLIASEIIENINLPIVFDRVTADKGFVNFYINKTQLANKVVTDVLTQGYNYGSSEVNKGKTLLCDYSSPNIGKPLHVGHIRSTILGDCLLKVSSFAGYKTHGINYLGDVGLHIGKLITAIDRWGNIETIEKNPEQEMFRLYTEYSKVEDEQTREIEVWSEAYFTIAALKLLLSVKKTPENPKPDIDDGDLDQLGELLANMSAAKALMNKDTVGGKYLFYALKGYNYELSTSFDYKEMINIFNGYYTTVAKEPEILQAARTIVKDIEEKEPLRIELLEKIHDWSMASFHRVYSLLDVEFDEISGQSYFSDAGKELVWEAIKKGLARYGEDGEVIAEMSSLTDGEIPDKIILKSDGTALYVTQDMGAARDRYEKWQFDKLVYITAEEQNTYFNQWFKILEFMGYEWAKDCSHIGFGLINLEEGKMSTREGRIILLEDVLNEASSRAKEEIEKRLHIHDSDADISVNKLSKQIGVGAVKYAVLKIQPTKNINFSWEDTLNFEGESGPYIQYTYARASSILRKIGDINTIPDSISLVEDSEFNLVSLISKFPDLVEENADNFEPHLIARYALDLATQFNRFYRDCRVAEAETPELKQSRIALVKAYRHTLKNVLNLLGMSATERM